MSMSDEESTSTAISRKSVGPASVLSGGRGAEPTQRFSALQQQLLCAAIHFFHRHIRSDPDVLQRMEGNQMFRLFFEVQYHGNKPDLNRIFPESVHDCSALHVCSFILSILHQGIFSVSAFIVSVIYLSRFKESSHITLHACTWRPLFLTSLLLADKMWEDKPVRNSSLAKLFPVLSNTELNKMEGEFLGEIRFNVLVKPDLFCSFCEKLLAEQVHQEITTCVSQSEYAATLQADSVEAPQPKPAPAPAAPKPAAEASNGGDGVGEEASAPRWPPGAGSVPRASDPVASAQPQAHVHAQPQPHPTAQAGGSCASQPPQPQPALHSLMTLRGSVGSAGTSTLKSAAQPSRSVSVHPLHRNESMKKHSMAKAEDSGEKGSRPGQLHQAPPSSHSHHGHLGGPPMRRSLPAKTSNAAYAPLSRVAMPSGSACFASSSGIGAMRDAAARVDGGSSHSGPGGPGGAGLSTCGGVGRGGAGDGASGASQVSSGGGCAGSSAVVSDGASSSVGVGAVGPRGAMPAEGSAHPCGRVSSGPCGGRARSGGGTPVGVPLLHVSGPGSSGSAGLAGGGGSRQLPQSSPRSPGIGPVVVAHEQPQPHQHQPQSRSSSQAHGSQSSGAGQHGQGLPGRAQAPRVATPPVPITSHSFPSGQGQPTAKLPSRVASPGCNGAGTGTPQQQLNYASQQQPARASSAPRVSGIAAHHATPPTGSTIRTTSQPMQAPSGYHPRHPHQVVFQQSPQTRGSSPAPGMAPMVGGSMAMNSGRGHHHVVVPATQMPFSGGSSVIAAHRPDLLSATRGRSPPPGHTIAPGSGAATVRAPRAVTPGALIKGISQGLQGGGVQRNSLGSAHIGMMVHRGVG
eukprot:TRINITY_DN71513_c0_g1_i1.p1 TRINITY_DN71513_c0_g1~~TRINITY_DN71513_c0_g1_i1.p1  ORF type:complete len:855 (-),score=120.42 TRINITY_DN71513_c0_g1_i1:148-2712(-)